MSRQLVRLTTMLSPAFPVGSFAFSGGLEQAVADRLVTDAATLEDWLGDILRIGSAWNDAVLLAEGWRKAEEKADLAEVNGLAQALAGSAGRFAETTAQGRAFIDAAGIWAQTHFLKSGDVAYPVAVGAMAAVNDIELDAVLPAFLNAAIFNLVQIAIRLSVIGQRGGLEVMAALEPAIIEVAQKAALSSLEDLGGFALVAEIAAMNHETLHSRIFRT